MQQWKMKDGFFKGAGIYEMQGIQFQVDRNGNFEAIPGKELEASLYVFARLVKSTAKQSE